MAGQSPLSSPRPPARISAVTRGEQLEEAASRLTSDEHISADMVVLDASRRGMRRDDDSPSAKAPKSQHHEHDTGLRDSVVVFGDEPSAEGAFVSKLEFFRSGGHQKP